jgi:hypothetical protein
LLTVSNFWQMRKGFLHDRLGSTGRTCRRPTAKYAVTSDDGLTVVAGGFVGTGMDCCGDRSGWLFGGPGKAGRRGLPGVSRGPGGNALARTPVVPYAGAVPDGGRQGSTAVAAVIGPHRLVA